MATSVRKQETEPAQATVEVFWKAYETLKPRQRQELAERILRDRKLLGDLFDHQLIEEAKRVKGKSVSLSEYESRFRRPAR